MKSDKRQKPRGMKHKIREGKKREERIGLAVTVVILIAIIFISGFLINSMLIQLSTNQPIRSTSQPKAAIVDHLSLTYPNQTFIQTATNTLKQAGYTVDYYPGEQVTVEFYRNIPTNGYNLIILRVHSAVPHHQSENPTRLALFTSESYSKTKYVYEQLAGQVGRVVYSEGGSDYFGIGPEFITLQTKGQFQNALIIMMGCEGLKYTPMAEAFVKKGAKVYMSWSDAVSASHTDQATINLLQHLLSEKQTIKQAVENTMKEVGPDPASNSLLTYYPLEVGEQTIGNTNG